MPQSIQSSGNLEGPMLFKSAVDDQAPGTKTVWTPTAGKKFRLMGGTIICGGTLVAAAIRTIDFQEETTGSTGLVFQFLAPVTAATVNTLITFDIKPVGYLASVAGKKLNAVVTGATYTTGNDSITVWGYEE